MSHRESLLARWQARSECAVYRQPSPVPVRFPGLRNPPETVLLSLTVWYNFGLDSAPDIARFEPGKIKTKPTITQRYIVFWIPLVDRNLAKIVSFYG